MAQPKFITNPTYDQIHNAALTIIREARTFGWIDAVVAPVRGGLLAGMISSYKLNVPLIPVHYSSKHGKGDDKNQSNLLPELPSNVKTICLIDDIVDSGHTMAEIASHYISKGVHVITAAIHYKEGAAFHPDLYFWRVPADSEFICYPYENN